MCVHTLSTCRAGLVGCLVPLPLLSDSKAASSYYSGLYVALALSLLCVSGPLPALWLLPSPCSVALLTGAEALIELSLYYHAAEAALLLPISLG